MRLFIILIFGSFLFVNCSKAKTASNENTQIISNKIASVSPTVEATLPLKSVVANVKLNSEQKKNLNESLPPEVREILEKAEKFEVLAEVDNEPDGLRFEPNRIAVITDEKDKKEILEAFYNDASGGNFPSACYIPHHSVRATYQKKMVEVEICFQCSLFVVKSPFGKFEGGMADGNQKSEELFNRIIQNQSVEIK